MDDKYSAMKNSRAETYPAIDVCKLAMAFLVVMIHVEAIYHLQLNCTMFYVTRTAVPFFFITAGFLLNEMMKMSDDALSIMSRYILRIFKMYLFWTAIYAPIAIYMSDCANAVVCVQQLIQYAKGVILVGESYYSWHLWFLLALLVALVSIRLMKQMHFSVVLIFVVGLLLMCLGQMMDRLYADGSSSVFVTALLHKYYALFQNTRNGIFQGISFVSAGMLISEILPPPGRPRTSSLGHRSLLSNMACLYF